MKFKPGDIIVPKARFDEWPSYGLTVESHEAGVLKATPIGGGFTYRFPPERIAFHDFIKVPKKFQKNPPWHEANFYAEWHDKNYRGWTTGDRWNGFATPHFEINEARRYAADSLVSPYSMHTHYDENIDAFVAVDPESPDDPEIYRGIMIDVPGRRLKVYPIGTYVWTWEEERRFGPSEEQRGAFDWYPEDAG